MSLYHYLLFFLLSLFINNDSGLLGIFILVGVSVLGRVHTGDAIVEDTVKGRRGVIQGLGQVLDIGRFAGAILDTQASVLHQQAAQVFHLRRDMDHGARTHALFPGLLLVDTLDNGRERDQHLQLF